MLSDGRQLGVEEVSDSSSCPHCSHSRIHVRLEQRIRLLRIKRHLKPGQVAGRVGSQPLWHSAIASSRLNQRDRMERAIAEVIRHHARNNPGELIHVDTKKFAVASPGGGWQISGRETVARGCTPRKKLNGFVAVP